MLLPSLYIVWIRKKQNADNEKYWKSDSGATNCESTAMCFMMNMVGAELELRFNQWCRKGKLVFLLQSGKWLLFVQRKFVKVEWGWWPLVLLVRISPVLCFCFLDLLFLMVCLSLKMMNNWWMNSAFLFSIPLFFSCFFFLYFFIFPFHKFSLYIFFCLNLSGLLLLPLPLLCNNDNCTSHFCCIAEMKIESFLHTWSRLLQGWFLTTIMISCSTWWAQTCTKTFSCKYNWTKENFLVLQKWMFLGFTQ